MLVRFGGRRRLRRPRLDLVVVGERNGLETSEHSNAAATLVR
jgi:hypothetical protein